LKSAQYFYDPVVLDGNRDARLFLGNLLDFDGIVRTIRQGLAVFDELFDDHVHDLVDVCQRFFAGFYVEPPKRSSAGTQACQPEGFPSKSSSRSMMTLKL
jgi:hypothetical protein